MRPLVALSIARQLAARAAATKSRARVHFQSKLCRLFGTSASNSSATSLRVVRLRAGPDSRAEKYSSTWADLKKEAGVHGRDMIQLLQKSTLPQFAILPRKNALLLVRAASPRSNPSAHVVLLLLCSDLAAFERLFFRTTVTF